MPAKKTSSKKSTGTKTESIKIEGAKLLEKIKELIKEGNVRKITIKNKKGKEIIVIPVTIGVVGAVLVPVLAAVGAMAALLTECTIVIERK